MTQITSISRRSALKTGLTALSSLCVASSIPRLLQAQTLTGDTYDTANGSITVHPVAHASFVMQTPDTVIYNDPVGGADKYVGLPPAQLILLTHEHGDHYNPDTLDALVGEDTRLITNPAVFDKLSGALKEKATAIGNGDSTEAGTITVDAIAAYNLTEDRLQYHPKGRDNGYILSIDGMRVYIAGDTEAVPEMRELSDIQMAFVPMNLPYTMGVEQAASGVLDFAPEIVYPYHYKGSNIDEFEKLINQGNEQIKVIKGAWYG